MLKTVKIYCYFPVLILTLIFIGCSSGEYDSEKHDLSYDEKSVKVDTLKKITINDDIKDDINKTDIVKETYTFTVQIGAFANPSNFSAFYENAKRVLGDDVFYEQSGNLYKIRIGGFSARGDAFKLLELTKSKGYLDAFIVSKKR